MRPIGKVFMKQYPSDLIESRKNFKPGVLPITAISKITSLEDIFSREREYIKSKLEKPVVTDIRYFFKIMLFMLSGNRSK